MIRIFILLQVLLLSCQCEAVQMTKADTAKLSSFWTYAGKQRLTELPVNERIPLIARFFLNTPYQGNTLNVTRKELPVINLRELDCVTFVENVLALANLSEYNEKAIPRFIDNIVRIRYRDGEIVDYCSRLHYSTDWLYEMGRQHLLTNVTLAAGGIPYRPDVCFMSQNSHRYPPLKDTRLLAKIKEIETEMNKRPYSYIPKAKVNQSYPKMNDGDVILITTGIKGLDTSHLGFAIRKNGKIYLLHASSKEKKVVLSQQPLQEYLEGITSHAGIIIGRTGEA